MPVIHSVIDNRYRLDELLAQGAQGRVYRAYDRLSGRVRAIKMATRKKDLPSYRREFLYLAQFRHPHIVRPFDFGSQKSRPFIVMEYLPRDFLSANLNLRDPKIFVSLVAQVIDALAVIHARGLIHRDIKPHNLMLGGDARSPNIRLGDFGLMSTLDGPIRAAGTLPYIAPEALRVEQCDGRSDLFSLGMVLYEYFAPEQIEGTVDALAEFHKQPRAPLYRVDPTIPQSISDFVSSLIRFDADQRPANALSTLRELHRIEKKGSARVSLRGVHERITRIGAVSHRKHMVRSIKNSLLKREDFDSLYYIQGKRGRGKSPAIREVSATLAAAGLRIVRLSGLENRSLFEYLQNAARFMAQAQDETREPVPFESLPRLDVAGICEAISKQKTVLIVEDFDDLEREDRYWLSEIFRALNGKKVALLTTGQSPASELNAYFSRISAFQLRPLTREQIGELIGHRLQGLHLPKPVLTRILNDTQGMPSLVERTLSRLLSDQAIVPKAGGFSFIGGKYRVGQHNDQEAWKDKYNELSTAAKKVVSACAVLSDSFDLNMSAALSGLMLSDTASALVELTQSGLLKLTEATEQSRYRFAYSKAKHLFYQRQEDEERRRYHDRAAAAFVLADGSSKRERIEHLLRGSDNKAAGAAVLSEARVLKSERRGQARLEILRAGFRVFEKDDEVLAAQVALELGDDFAHRGDLQSAKQWLQRAMDLSLDNSEIVARAKIGLAEVLLDSGELNQAKSLLERAVLGKQLPQNISRTVRLLRMRARVELHKGNIPKAEKFLRNALNESDKDIDAENLIELNLELANVLRIRGEILDGVRYARRAMTLAQRHRNQSAVAAASAVLARGFSSAGRYRAARRALHRGYQGAQQANDRLRQGLLLKEFGNLLFRECKLDAARLRYMRGLDMARSCGARNDEAACLHNIGLIYLRLGEFHAARLALEEAARLSEEAGDRLGRAFTEIEIAHLEKELGDTAKGLKIIKKVLRWANKLNEPALLLESQAIFVWLDAVICAGWSVSFGAQSSPW